MTLVPSVGGAFMTFTVHKERCQKKRLSGQIYPVFLMPSLFLVSSCQKGIKKDQWATFYPCFFITGRESKSYKNLKGCVNKACWYIRRRSEVSSNLEPYPCLTRGWRVQFWLMAILIMSALVCERLPVFQDLGPLLVGSDDKRAANQCFRVILKSNTWGLFPLQTFLSF